MRKILSRVRKCVEDYKMIEDGDIVAVGVSGGKDSLLTLAALHKLSEFMPQHFQVKAITIGLTRDEKVYEGVAAYCASLGIEYHFEPTDIQKIVFELRDEKNPCSLCANMRRGALNRKAVSLGCNKVALGHHMDDTVETFLMSLFYEGRISCFSPVTRLSRSGITVIRPLLYVEEREVRRVSKTLPVMTVESSCPNNGHSKREDTKLFIRELRSKYTNLPVKLFGAIKRLPLPGWEIDGEKH